MRQRYTQVFQDLKHQMMFSLGILGSPGGGVIILVLQYWHAFNFSGLERSRSEKRQGTVMWLRVITLGLACRDKHIR
jgi:hypothetical protein